MSFMDFPSSAEAPKEGQLVQKIGDISVPAEIKSPEMIEIPESSFSGTPHIVFASGRNEGDKCGDFSIRGQTYKTANFFWYALQFILCSVRFVGGKWQVTQDPKKDVVGIFLLQSSSKIILAQALLRTAMVDIARGVQQEWRARIAAMPECEAAVHLLTPFCFTTAFKGAKGSEYPISRDLDFKKVSAHKLEVQQAIDFAAANQDAIKEAIDKCLDFAK